MISCRGLCGAALLFVGLTAVLTWPRYSPRDRFDTIARTLATSGELSAYGQFAEAPGEARAYRFVTPPPARASRP
ncbi:MAG: hypothetical protein DMF84_18760 [Acidobacteria bacterium]|nr:MAG: hypothetical protein DMF84_18760 [Acidobacteriota bacterium]